jgi:hypothetical protein
MFADKHSLLRTEHPWQPKDVPNYALKDFVSMRSESEKQKFPGLTSAGRRKLSPGPVRLNPPRRVAGGILRIHQGVRLVRFL